MVICTSALFTKAFHLSHSSGILLFIVIARVVLDKLHMPSLECTTSLSDFEESDYVRIALNLCGYGET